MTPIRFLVVIATMMLSGCSDTQCGGPGKPPELARHYAARDDEDDATLVVDAETAVLEYEAPDGTRWRARYAITARTTGR